MNLVLASDKFLTVIDNFLKPHFSSFSDNESKTKEGESHLAHSQSPHVRIDESQKEPRQPTAGEISKL